LDLRRLLQPSTACPAPRQIVELFHQLKHRPFADNDGAFDNIHQFADVAGPAVLLERRHRLLRNAGNSLRVIPGKFVCEEFYKEEYVLSSLPEWRDRDGKHVGPVEEGHSELAITDFFFQKPIGKGRGSGCCRR
jgi:hypothetical protein